MKGHQKAWCCVTTIKLHYGPMKMILTRSEQFEVQGLHVELEWWHSYNKCYQG